MSSATLTYRGAQDDLRAECARLPAIIVGHEPDPTGRIDAAKQRMAEMLLEKIHEAYEVKKTGGTDEMGITWPPLAPSTVRRKGHATIMVDTGGLEESLRPGSGHPDQIIRFGPGWIEVGSERSTPSGIPLTMLHAKGNANLPVRRILPEPGVELPPSWVEAMGQVLLDELGDPAFWRAYLGGKAA
jgi:hypothetical protein